MKIHVNGTLLDVDVGDDVPLLWVLRDHLKLTGTKFGCGIAACGACTVHLDGEAVRSCVLPVSACVGKKITTIEGLAAGSGSASGTLARTGSTAAAAAAHGEREPATEEGPLHPVQRAWIEKQVPQCGYCQSGMIMAVAALLAEIPEPSDAQIDEKITNICRCGTYVKIREAIHAAARSGVSERRGKHV